MWFLSRPPSLLPGTHKTDPFLHVSPEDQVKSSKEKRPEWLTSWRVLWVSDHRERSM